MAKLTRAALLVAGDMVCAEPPSPPVFPKERPVMLKKDRAGGGKNHIFGGSWRPHREKEVDIMLRRVASRYPEAESAGRSRIEQENAPPLTGDQIWNGLAPLSKRDHIAPLRGRAALARGTESTGALPDLPRHLEYMETHYQGIHKDDDSKRAAVLAQRSSELWRGRKICGLL
mmetsp:Transcript_63237/g.150829  ORF Transcript_63237/g.150829 Transcript_63237/m.150829 type:complete len:173 (+) Transcript_63237:66-584(+)